MKLSCRVADLQPAILLKNSLPALFKQEHVFQRKDFSDCFRITLSILFFKHHEMAVSNNKLKFVNNKLCLGTRYGFFNKLYKFTCRSLRQARFAVTDIILVNFLNFERI